jgi:hypothetical protein
MRTKATVRIYFNRTNYLPRLLDSSVLRLLMRLCGVPMSLGRMLMRQLRVLGCFFVIALLVVFCCRVMCLGSVFVVLGCLAM